MSMLICERHIPKNYRRADTGKRYWAVSEGLEVLHPERFAMVRKDVLSKALTRGTQVHAIFADILATRGKIPGYAFELKKVPGVLRGYATGLYDWADKHNVIPRKIEYSSVWERWNVAGTADTEAYYGRERLIIIGELKSGIEERLNRVQVQIYGQMEAYREAKAYLLIYVDKEGRVKEKWVQPSPHDIAWFCAGIGVLNGRMNG